MNDDIMDNSLTRRGQPFWYLQNYICLSATNDGMILEQVVFQLLRIHFKDKPYYVDLLDSFHNVNIVRTFKNFPHHFTNL